MRKTILIGALVMILALFQVVQAQDVPPPNCGGDNPDPTCTQQCPRDDDTCVCTWEPDCIRDTPMPKPTTSAGHAGHKPTVTIPAHWLSIAKAYLAHLQ